MSEPIVQTPPVAPPATPAPSPVDDHEPPEGEPKAFDAEYVGKLRQEAAKYRTEAKANADAAKRLADIEEAQKTETQKLADRLAAAEQKAQDAELKALRSDIAQAKGVPASLLSGTSAEELNASADALLAFRGAASKPAGVPAEGIQGNVGRPIGAGAPQLTQSDVQGMYAAKDYEGIEKARAGGRLNNILGIS